MWASDYPELAAYSGNCSLLISEGSHFNSNYAAAAGAVVFSTYLDTTRVSCDDNHFNDIMHFTWNSSSSPCTAWQGNEAGQLGYGNTIASVPANLSVDMAVSGRYVSNDNSRLGVTVQVLDAAGTQVTGGKLLPLLVCPSRSHGLSFNKPTLHVLDVVEHMHCRVVALRRQTVCIVTHKSRICSCSIERPLQCTLHRCTEAGLSCSADVYLVTIHMDESHVLCVGPAGLQPLRVDLNVMLANAIATGPDLQPQLEGQKQAIAKDNGNITISQLVLRAAPGDYLLSVTLLDHPQVADETDLV